MIEPWPLVDSEVLADHRIFRVRRDRKISPRTGQTLPFHVLECPDWVNVLALTADGQLVLVEQFRHGTNSTELEIPGGVTDPGDLSPVDTAVRELREETGFSGRDARIIGRVSPNAAILNNTCHTVLIEDCVRLEDPQLDPGEDLLTRVIPLDTVARLVRDGRIRHSLVIAALYHFELWRGRW